MVQINSDSLSHMSTGSPTMDRRAFLATSGILLAASSLPAALGETTERTISMSQLAREVMPSNVRIFVSGEGQPASGSGTMVNAPAVIKPLLHQDEILVLSAGHVFFDHNEYTQIEIDVFHDPGRAAQMPDAFSSFEARCIGYMSEQRNDGKQPSDVAVLAMRVPAELEHLVKTVNIATADSKFVFGDKAVTVGCPGGKTPVWQDARILRHGRNPADTADDITTISSPKEGHSGGGLFNTQGELIGICSGNTDVTPGTIDFTVPELASKELFVSQHNFDLKENQMIFRSQYELDQYRKRVTPDWAEYAKGRGGFAAAPDVHSYLGTLAEEYKTAQKELLVLEESYARLGKQLELQTGTLVPDKLDQLKTDLQSLGKEALAGAREKVSRYKPIRK